MPIIECELCGEDTDLTGRQIDSGIQITCNRCHHQWLRDTEPSCSKCGSRNVRPFKEPLIQRARDTAYSIVGEKTIHLCVACDVEEIERRSPTKIHDAPREDPWK